MPSFGPTELFIILMIVIVLFGAGRITRLGGELGGAIANFRREVKVNESPANDESTASATEA